MAVPGQVADLDVLETSVVTFPSDGAVVDGYLAQPRQPGPRPGIILIHDSFGLTDHARDLARRLANADFTVLAPNLYTRVGSPGSDDLQAARAKLFSLPDEQAVRDLEAAAGYLRTQGGVTGKVGCIGCSSGGRHGLLLACCSDAVDAVVDCWGTFIERATATELTTPNRPVPVVDLIAGLRCPLYAAFGAEDPSPSPAVAEALRVRLERAGKPATVKIFANAGHHFLADHRPSYREGPAFELWSDVISFFDANLR